MALHKLSICDILPLPLDLNTGHGRGNRLNILTSEDGRMSTNVQVVKVATVQLLSFNEIISRPNDKLPERALLLMMKFGCRTVTELIERAVESKKASSAQINSVKNRVDSIRPFECIVKGLPELRSEIERRVLSSSAQEIRERHGIEASKRQNLSR